ncbi:hypothetical protein LCGC14_0824270 [marine sediment metagenome]|uniref:HNH nuclease domain-containing protein n=1 Tax=marine sediment metagenome TaxID=412755 RepID=A0A0F9SQG4_9ZZZZ
MICAVENCGKPHYARSWCSMHYQRWYKHGDVKAVRKLSGTCQIDGCVKTHSARGWCDMHWMRWYRHGDPLKRLRLAPGEITICTLEGCTRPHGGKGLCQMHYGSRVSRPRRRARKRGAFVVDFTPEQWTQLKESFDHCCAYCGNQAELEQDHVTPISKGGNHTGSNIVPACRSCNAKKSDSMGKYIPRAVIV